MVASGPCAVLLAATLLTVGCQDVTAVPASRLPPPDREQLDDGRLHDPVDPCGALDVDSPQRLSATPGDSDGARVAVLARAGEEPVALVAWMEREPLDPDPFPRVDVQLLLSDGVRLGDVVRSDDLPAPTRIDVAAQPGADTFFVVVDDAFLGATAIQVSSYTASPRTARRRASSLSRRMRSSSSTTRRLERHSIASIETCAVDDGRCNDQ